MTQEQVGQGDFTLWLATDDDMIELCTLEQAAVLMKYKPKYIGQLCADLKLIAIKISGRWFPHRDACMYYGDKPLDDIPF